MKLALVVPGGFAGPGDVIPALSALADDLSRRHEVHVFDLTSPGASGHGKRGRLHVHLVPLPLFEEAPRLVRRARLVADLSRLAREVSRAGAPTPFDVLHAFWANEP